MPTNDTKQTITTTKKTEHDRYVTSLFPNPFIQLCFSENLQISAQNNGYGGDNMADTSF